MNCEEVRDLLVAYLDDEVTPSEQELLRLHLATCPACRDEMTALWKLQSRVQQSMKADAARAAAPAHAWSQLQTRLAVEGGAVLQAPTASGVEPDRGRTRMKTSRALAFGALAVVAVLVIGLATVVLVPPARAAVVELLTGLIRVQTGNNEMILRVDLVPLVPGYIPADLNSTFVGEGGETGERFFEFRFYDADTFVVVFEQQVGSGSVLPEGEPAAINGHDAVFITGLAGTVRLNSPDPQSGYPMFERGGGGGSVDLALLPDTLDYTDGQMLAWVQDGLYVEVLSNLPEDELFHVAESMAPAEQVPPESVPPQIAEPPVSESESVGAPPVMPDPALMFTSLVPGYRPDDFYAGREVTIFDQTGAQITESRYYGNERFFILTQRVALEGESLGAGEPMTVGGSPAVLETGLGGVAYLVIDTLQNGQASAGPGGGGGGGGGAPPNGDTPLYPDTIAFTGGSRLVWVLDGIRVEMLTNLPLEELMRVAEQLAPSTF